MTDENERVEDEVQPEQAAEADDRTEELEQLRADLETARGQVTRLEHERYLLARGVPEEDVDMVKAGILDPVKVTRSALQNATSVASSLLTTEGAVSIIKEPTPPMPAGAPGMM